MSRKFADNMSMEALLKEAAAQTPDPKKSSKNLDRLVKSAPKIIEKYQDKVDAIARLFAYSQFLADYSVLHPVNLEVALREISEPVTRQGVISEAYNRGFVDLEDPGLNPGKPKGMLAGSLPLASTFKVDVVRLLREIKKHYLLRITLRDITGMIMLEESMAELSALAEAILELALNASYAIVRQRFGDIENNSFSVIALGKLGAGELNYSSDIDIITVYESDEGISTGVMSPTGIVTNRVKAHEYFCKVTEVLAGLLQQQTEDGIACRVDLRLRPDGRRGELSLALNSYITYYESWGRTWERMALIRARHVAGDSTLGEKFLKSIEPFVWKQTADFYDIDEIRELKKKIDTVFDANDIKRGYGGIREIEFFIQTFQLLYGGQKKNLRTGRLAVALDELLKDEFLTTEDVKTLSDNYRFLRRLEHVLQMKDDLQTHSLPSQAHEFNVLARKLKFADGAEFSSELRLRRLMVRDMYNSLLGGPDSQKESAVLLENELTDKEIRDFLSYKGFTNPEAALKNIKALNEQISFGKTIRERTLLRKTIPMFLEQALKSESKDRVLSMFVTFVKKIGNHESYIDILSERPDTTELIISTFARSTYITQSMLGLDNLESIFEYPHIRVDYKSVKERLEGILEYSQDPMNSLREFRTIEEMRAGLLFIKGILEVDEYSVKLSKLAETIVRTVLRHLTANKDFAIIALGKLGSGELNIGSDLDLVFVSGKKSADRLAEKLIKYLSEYTSKGILYEVDMRLRPDGSKGILANDTKSYRNYYFKSAHPWELQALLRARPIAGDRQLKNAFHELKKEVIIARGSEITASDVKTMRSRIISELSKESAGYDIKLGPGGIEEIEFLVQYLQLKNAATYPDLVTHKTTTALKRLAKYGIINSGAEEQLLDTYRFMRTIDTILRLNEENVLKTESSLVETILGFLNLKSKEELFSKIEGMRSRVLKLTGELYS